MRKNGMLIIAVFVLLGFVIAHFFTDKWLEQKIEAIGSDMVGAKVELDGFNVHFLTLQVGWGGLQVTDPDDTWRNMVQTGRAEFNLAAEPLFYKRLIIEALRLENIRTNTPRATDGEMPPKKVLPSDSQSGFLDNAAKSLTRQLSKSSGVDFSKLDGKIDVDKVVEMLDLQTLKNVETFQTDIETTSDRWKKDVAGLKTLKVESEQIAEKVTAIQLDQLKTVPAITDAMERILLAKKQVETIQETLRLRKSLLIEDGKRLEGQIKSIDDWIREDIQRAKDGAKLPDFNAKNIAFILFGPTLGSHIETAEHYFKMAKHYQAKLPPSEPKVPAPPRFKGQDIHFPDHRHWPKFWLKKMVISAGNKDLFSGSLDDLTTHPNITGKPTVLNLRAERTTGTAYTVFASVDRTREGASDRFQWTAENMSLKGVRLAKSDPLPKEVESGTMNLNLAMTIRDGVLDGSLAVVAHAVSFRFEESKKDDLVSQIIRDLFLAIEKVTIDFKFSGPPEDMKIDFGSNLDELFSARLKGVVSEQIAMAKEKIERRLKEKLEPKKQETLKRYQQRKETLNQEIAQIEATINEKKERVESKKKELENRLEAEKQKLKDKVNAEKNKQEDKLKEKAKDKLKDLFKR
jgi:uncharacterized protein (TIGR03545 family)